MDDETRIGDTGNDPEPVREFQLEGSGLYLVGALLLLLLVGSFFLGRWYERSGSAAQVDRSPSGTTNLFSDGVDDTEPPAEKAVEATTDYFDTIPGGGRNAEPEREIGTPVQEPVPEPAVELPPPPGAMKEPEARPSSGPFYVQVAAVRDRRAAESVKAELDRAGYRCRIHTASDDSGSLYKVQVGGFPDRATAGETVAKLEKAGYKGVWTTRAE